jgi:hypothetical protein
MSVENKEAFETTAYYEIQERVPGANAFGGASYWAVLNEEGMPLPWRTFNSNVAVTKVLQLLNNGRDVRLVRTTKTLLRVMP